MRYLLDTHVWLWWTQGSTRISENVQKTLNDSAHEVFLSVASMWEISIKHRLGKLILRQSPDALFFSELEKQQIATLPISAQHAVQTGQLPLFHNDPFDRMLIAQCMVERFILVTADTAMAPYDVSTLFIR